MKITQNFRVLREGILRDVFSQRASSAWQGVQPQKLTVSFLLPGSGTADHWLDFLQSQRHFWPTLITRHASLAPLSNVTRRVQAKHLWDLVNLNWPALARKLYVSKPTGLSREALWRLLFLAKHRADPWQEQEYWGADRREVWDQWRQAQEEMGVYKAGLFPFFLDVATASRGFDIEQ